MSLDLDLDLGDLELDLGDLDLRLGPDPDSIGANLSAGFDEMQAGLFGLAMEAGRLAPASGLYDFGLEGLQRNLDEAEESRGGQTTTFTEAFERGEYLSSGKAVLNSIIGSAPSMALQMSGILAGPGGLATTSVLGNIADLKTRAGSRDLSGLEYLAGGVAGTFDMFLLGRLTKGVGKQATEKMMAEEGAEATANHIASQATLAGVKPELARALGNGAVEGLKLSTVGAGTAGATEGIVGGAHYLSEEGDFDFDQWTDNMVNAAVAGAAVTSPIGAYQGYVRQRMMDNPEHQGVLQRIANSETGKQARDVWDLVAGRPMDIASRKFGEAIQPVVDLIDSRNKDTSVSHVKERYEADWTHKLFESGREAKREFKKLSKAKRKEYGSYEDYLIEEYKKRDSTSTAASKLRDVIAEIGAKGKGLGLVSSLVKDYMPAFYDRKRILANKEEFSRQVMARTHELLAKRETKLKDEGKFDNSTFVREVLEAEDSANTRLQRFFDLLERNENPRDPDATPVREILGKDDTGQRNFYEGILKGLDEEATAYQQRKAKGEVLDSEKVGQTFGNMELSRTFPEMQQEFHNQWSVGENKGKFGFENLRDYVRNAAHRVAGAEVFGREGEKLNAAIAKSQLNLLDQGKPVMAASDIQKIYDTVKGYDRVLGQIQNPLIRKAANIARVVGSTSVLPLVTFGSFTEGFNIAAKADMTKTLVASLKVLGRGGYELGRSAFGLERTKPHQSRAAEASKAGQSFKQVDDVLAARFDTERLSDGLNKFQHWFFRVNGLSFWTQYLRNVGAEVTRMQVKSDITDFRNATTPDNHRLMAKQRLDELGVRESDYDLIIENAPNDPQRQAVMAEAIRRFNRETVLHPDFSDKPLWMSSQQMWIFSQLMAYPTMFTNTVLPMIAGDIKGGDSKRKLNAAFIVGGIMLVGGLQMAIRDILTGKDPSDRDLFEGISKVALRGLAPSPISTVAGVLTGATYGENALAGVTAPIFSKPADIIYGIRASDSAGEAAIKPLLQVSPLALWVKEMFD